MWYASLMITKSPDQYIASLGFEFAYRVGGSVRDDLLGKQPKDTDYVIFGVELEGLAAALHAHQAKLSPLKLRGNGPQIGWRAKVKGLGVLEVVLPRVEHSTGPGRHDFDIYIDPSISVDEDAERRDFTMNAVYYNVHNGAYLDPFGGIADIEKHIVKVIGFRSFEEDPLRILRALRFMSKLGFGISDETYLHMLMQHNAVTGLTQKGVSGTALSELEGILMGQSPGNALITARDSGVLETFLPELGPMLHFEQRSRYHAKPTDEHVFDCIQAAAAMHSHAPIRVRMALLFHDSGKPDAAFVGADGLQHYYADPSNPKAKTHEEHGARRASEALNRLNAPKQLRHDVVTLIERHMIPVWDNIRPFKVRQWRSEIGDDLLRDLITHRMCDVLGKGGDVEEAVEVLTWIAAEQQRAIDNKVPVKVTDLAITGKDLVNMGIRGPEVGMIQRALLHEVLAQPKLNTTDWLLRQAASQKENNEKD